MNQIKFDPWLEDFFGFANKNLSYVELHCLMERSAGLTLKEVGKNCPRLTCRDGTPRRQYRFIMNPDALHWWDRKKSKTIKNRTHGYGIEFVRCKVLRSKNLMKKFLS